MRTNTAIEICKELDITAEDVRVAAAVQLTLDDTNTDKSKEDLADAVNRAERLLSNRGFVNAIRWGTWIKNAKDKTMPGRDFDELMKLRKEDADAKES